MALNARIGELLCQPALGRALGRATGGWIPAQGLRIRVDPEIVSPRVAAAIFWGLYERAERRFLGRYLDPDLDVVELGASLGLVSSWIAQRLPPERKLVCVEANADLIPLLEASLARNAPGRPVVVRNQAIAYGAPEVSFFFGKSTEGGTIAFAKEEGQRTVPAVGLSQLLAEEGIGPYLLVSDIEAGEGAILEHDAAALERCQRMVIELHEPHTAPELPRIAELRARIEALGFRLLDQHGPVFVFER
jgi:FkbM family methyltransferase